jgi:hypothetical protein
MIALLDEALALAATIGQLAGFDAALDTERTE